MPGGVHLTCSLHSCGGLPGQAAEVDGAPTRCAPEVVNIGCDRGEACAPTGLLGVDLAVERLPATSLVKRRVVRFAEQQREIDRAFVFHRLHSSLERDAGISATPERPRGRDPADAAGVHLASVPCHLTAKDADMT